MINDLDHFIRLQKHLSLNESSLLDMNILNQIPLLIGSLFGWRDDALRMLIFFLLLLLLLQLLLGLFGKCRNMSKLEGKAVNASQALNYCKHMVMICQEAMAGNHSLRRCKALVCDCTCFVDCRELQVLILVEVGTKRESCW